jgi:hypothetical protein
LLALGAAVLLSGLAGCGGGGGGGGSAQVASNLPVALRHLVAARTGVVSTRYVIFAPSQFVPPIFGVTRFDNAVKRLEIKLDLRQFMSLYQPSLPPSSRVGKVSDWRFDVIADNSHSPVMYLSSPLFEEPSFQKKLPARVRNKPWMKLDLVEALLQGGSVGQVTAFLPKGASPAGFVTALSGHATSEKGERIDGVDTNRYTELVNFRGHVKELPGFIQKALAGTPPIMHAVVWVDGSSTVRRISLTSRPLRHLQGGVLTATMNFRDLGGKVNVDLPPRSEVFDAMQLPP